MTTEHDHHDHPELPELSPEDARILDLLADSGYDATHAGTDADSDARAERLMRLLGTLDAYPVEEADELLVDATMVRIDQHEREQRSRMRLGAVRETLAARRLRMPDFISVAAIILIGISVVWPIMHQIRTQSVDLECRDRMRALGGAFTAYATDYAGELPMMTAGADLSGWSRTVRHVENLTPLVEMGYCEHGHLNCPGNCAEHGHGHEAAPANSRIVSGFSYRLPATSNGRTPALGTERHSVALLGDRNPLVDVVRGVDAQNGRWIGSLTISFNHGGRGQNILLSDGSVLWMTSPVLDQPGAIDNIWLPHGASDLRNGARPASFDDSVLVH